MLQGKLFAQKRVSDCPTIRNQVPRFAVRSRLISKNFEIEINTVVARIESAFHSEP